MVDVSRGHAVRFAPSAMSSLIDSPVRYDLAESTCPPLRLGEVVDVADLPDLPLGYGTSRGDDELRSLIAADVGVTADQVLTTVGAVEAMYLLAQDCADGRTLLASPYFPPAGVVPAGLGSPVDLVRLSFDDGYRLPVGQIASALTPSTRLVSLASPQNPSGVRITEPELRELLAAVDDRAPDAVVLVDETYRASTYGDATVPRSAAGLSPRVVTCSSLSKAHGAPALRLGWLTTTDAGLYERLRAAKFSSTISCSTVDEMLALAVLRQQSAILASRAERLRHALDELERWVVDRPVDHVRPDGGALCCLRLGPDRTTPESVADFYARLAEREVRVAPGSWFGESDRVFRLGFGHLDAAVFTAALDRLSDALGGS